MNSWFCLSEHDNGGTEDSSGRTETGERLPASTQGHDVQRKDQRTDGKIRPGNGVIEDKESGKHTLSYR